MKKKSSGLIRSASLGVLDSNFVPSRFGWLGGDVAGSFALPDPGCFVVKNGALGLRKSLWKAATCNTWQLAEGGEEYLVSKRYLWIFGDSLVGTSSDTQ